MGTRFHGVYARYRCNHLLRAEASELSVDSGCAPDQNCQGFHALRVALFLRANEYILDVS